MNSPVREFRDVAKRYWEAHWQLFPDEASEVGFHEHDAELGENGALVWREHARLMQSALAAVEALPDSAFAGDDWLDRRGFLAHLRTELHWTADLERWRNEPQVHCNRAVHSILLLLIRNSDRLARIRPAIESRLAKIPRFLAQAASCLHRPVPHWVRLTRECCAGAVEFLEAVEEQLVPLSPKPEKTRALLRAAAVAFEKYAKAACAQRPGPAHGYAIGRETFEFYIREKTGLPYSLPEARALGEALVARFEREVESEARKFGRRKARAIIEEAAARWAQSSGPLFATYEQRTRDLRAAFARAGLVTFPKGERCHVLRVPPFLRTQIPTAAYHQPGAFDRDQTGIFWVNDPEETLRDPERRAAEVRQHFGLELTCAHEAYPGHHLQFAIQNRHSSKLRRLFAHAIFYEGWTLWTEKMCVDQGIVTLPEARLLQLHDALWRAHRIVIDCGLHDRSLTHAAACRRLQEGIGFTAARARADVNWYTTAPTVPMSYLLGRLEVERLHKHFVGNEGWSLRRFNDWMLSFGAIPWAWIWESTLRPAA
ncbi:MAG TPA: DUF885 family protein [Chthoniobacteraceae bacterium]|nr:DUF885 family protein [Chthoniobacteraceae bacterium]